MRFVGGATNEPPLVIAPQTQISSTVIASSGQTETQDSQPRHSSGFATLVLSSAASNTSAGQTSTHSPHDLHFSASIFGKYINSPHQILVRMRQKNGIFISSLHDLAIFCKYNQACQAFSAMRTADFDRHFPFPIHALFFRFQNVAL